VSGLVRPDPFTFEVQLSQPEGELGAVLSAQGLSPIPPLPGAPAVPAGVADGHDKDYGRFLVSTGPYMIEGSDRLDFSGPPGQQTPVSGYVPGTSLVLVRNPSWSPATDRLRPAYADRIEFTVGGSLDGDSRKLDKGKADLVLDSGPPLQAPLDQVARYRDDPSLGHVYLDERDFVRAVQTNLAVPPFDDVHVRKAVNLVLNKAKMIQLAGGSDAGSVAGHLVLNSLEDNLLAEYDPYVSAGAAGDVAAARAEMRQSRYDGNRDGICDDPSCRSVLTVSLALPPFALGALQAKRDLSQIGIHLRDRAEDPPAPFVEFKDPTKHVPMFFGAGFGKDFLDASNFFTGLFYGPNVFAGGTSNGTSNGTLVGATPGQLRSWKYSVASVPSVDGRIEACLPLLGAEEVRCWAALDQYMMTNVVPWAPYVFERYVRVVPSRVVHYSFDQSVAMPALDQIALLG
jgi:peptide/nickel transport system substrate-binding protein